MVRSGVAYECSIALAVAESQGASYKPPKMQPAVPRRSRPPSPFASDRFIVSLRSSLAERGGISVGPC